MPPGSSWRTAAAHLPALVPKDSILGRNVSRMSRFLIICCILIDMELQEPKWVWYWWKSRFWQKSCYHKAVFLFFALACKKCDRFWNFFLLVLSYAICPWKKRRNGEIEFMHRLTWGQSYSDMNLLEFIGIYLNLLNCAVRTDKASCRVAIRN